MSVKLMGLVWDRYPVGGGEFILALKLADNAHHDGTRIFPSVKTMAEMTRQSRRTVQYQLRHMRDTRFLILVKAGRGGRGDAGYAAEYRINPEWINGADFASLRELSTVTKEKGAQFAPFSSKVKGAIDGAKGRNLQQKRVQLTTEKGATAIAPQPSLTVIEPSMNRQRRAREADAPLAAAEISKALIGWERGRGKAARGIMPSNQAVIDLAGLNVTPEELRSAYDAAVADRVATGDPTPVNAGFVRAFVERARRPKPAPQTRPVQLRALDDNQLNAYARQIGVAEARIGETRDAFIARIQTRQVEQRGMQ